MSDSDKCSGCGKRLPDGYGNQEQIGATIYRYCDSCWKKRCEGELPARPKKGR